MKRTEIKTKMRVACGYREGQIKVVNTMIQTDREAIGKVEADRQICIFF